MLFLWLLTAAAVVALDQITKAIVVSKLMPIGSAPFIKGIIRFQYAENTGAAFSMLSDHRWFFLIFSTVAIVAMLVLLIVYRKKISPFFGFIMSMIIGGGIGNQIDRFLNGYVVDFLDFEFVRFAVFNVADMFVTVGAFLAIFYILFVEMKSSKGKNGGKTIASDENSDVKTGSESEND